MKIFMIRHGKADYSYGDAHNFIGHGHYLAKLSEEYIDDVIKTSKDSRLKEATLIVSSPYTRALQTAAIISKETGLDIKIEPDLREWEPDKTYQYKAKEMKEYYNPLEVKDFLVITGNKDWFVGVTKDYEFSKSLSKNMVNNEEANMLFIEDEIPFIEIEKKTCIKNY